MKITLKWKYLHYDIDQIVHRYAKARLNDKPELLDNADLSSMDESDTNLIIRYCETGSAKLREYLHNFITNVTTDTDDTLPSGGSTQSWTFDFNANADFDGKALAGLMHWFIVRFCVWQWLKGFSPNEQRMEKEEVADLEKQIKRMATDLAMPIKERRSLLDENTDVEIIYGEY